MNKALECVALAGKAGGLRTAAMTLRIMVQRGATSCDPIALAASIEFAADKIDDEAAALLGDIEASNGQS